MGEFVSMRASLATRRVRVRILTARGVVSFGKMFYTNPTLDSGASVGGRLSSLLPPSVPVGMPDLSLAFCSSNRATVGVLVKQATKQRVAERGVVEQRLLRGHQVR